MPSQFLILAVLIVSIALSSVLFFALRATGKKLIYEKKNRYHHIMVYEDGFIRTLFLGNNPDAGKQSRIDLDDPDCLLLEYTKLVFAALLVKDAPLRVLIIGLGGGVIPRAINRYIPDAEIDVVDIDPDIVDVAEKFFSFEPCEKIKIHISDGRAFIREAGQNIPVNRYDMVILDAFNSRSIPRHLTTREFLRELMQILTPDGVVAANVLIDNRLFHSILRTYRKVFKRCYVFLGGRARNAVLVSPGPDAPGMDYKEAEKRSEELQKLYHFNFSMISVARQFRPRYTPKISAKVLSDF